MPILLIGGAVALYFYLNRKKPIITVGPMSDPIWNAPENFTPVMSEDDRWLGVPLDEVPYILTDGHDVNIPTHGDTFDYYQEMRGEIISGNPRRRVRKLVTTC